MVALRVSACLGVFLVWSAAVASAQRPTFEGGTSVVAVEISVQVIADGAPVRGLTREDFEVTHHGRQIRITDFDVVDLATLESRRGSAVATIPESGRRHFLMLFDLTFSAPHRVLLARRAAREVLAQLHPSDLVAVATYGGAGGHGARLVQGFTLDRRQILRSIETLGLADDGRRPPDPLGLAAAELPGTASDASLRESIAAELEAELEALAEGAARREMTANVQVFTKAMGELAAWLRPVNGRKHVVLFSQGFDSSLLTGVGGRSAGERSALRRQAEYIASGQYWMVDSNVRHGDTTTQNDMTLAMLEFVKADATIQAVDITGIPATGGVDGGVDGISSAPASSGPAAGVEALFAMADQTGGELYEKYNDLGEAMGHLLEMTGVTYVLTIQPEVALDGEYHPIDVRLKRGPRGARLLHRPGYFAPRPYGELGAHERIASAASLVMGGADGGTIDLSVLTLPSTGGGETGRVEVLVAVDGESLLRSAPGAVATVPLELFVYALSPEGAVHDYIAQTLSLDLASVRARLQGGGIKIWGSLDLPVGEHLSRVLVRNGLTGETGLRTEVVEVATPGTPVLLPPLVPEPAGSWLTARLDGPTREEAPSPFTLFGESFVPATKPLLTSGEPLHVRLAGRGLENLVSVDGELRRDGEAIGGAVSDARLIALPAGGAELVVTFDPGPVAPGDYTLEMTVAGASVGSLSSSIDVVVTE